MKKIYRLLAIITAFGAVLAGCTRAEEDTSSAKSEIKFSASVGTFQIKATDTAFEEGDVVGLFAGNPVNVDNAKLTFTGGALVPDEPIYWGDSQLLEQPSYFYAYYPYDAFRSQRYGSHSVALDQSSHDAFTASDFMAAMALSSPADGAVQLNFAHIYSKIIFTVDNRTSEGGRIESITIGNVAVQAEADAGEANGLWTDRNSIASVKAASVTDAQGSAAWAVIIPPQSVAPMLLIVMDDGRQYTFNTEDVIYFASGCRYHASIVIDDTTVGADFTSDISDWIDNGDIEFGQFKDYGDWYIFSDSTNASWNWTWMQKNGKTRRLVNINYYQGDSFKFYSSQLSSIFGNGGTTSLLQEGVYTALVLDGGEFTLPVEGEWQLEVDAESETVSAWLINEFEGPENWSIVGTVLNGTWLTDTPMSFYQNGRDYVYYIEFEYHAGEEFKFRKNNLWDENYGVYSSGSPLMSGSMYSLTWYGENILLETDGVWYVEMCPSGQWIYVERRGDIPGGTGPFYDLGQIQPVVELEDGMGADITQVVYAVTTNGFVLFDGKYSIFIYTRSTPSVNVGDVVSVWGTKTTYNGVPELTDVQYSVLDSNYPDMWSLSYEDITAAIDNYYAQVAMPIAIEGVLIDSKNMTVEGSNIKACIYYAPESFGLASLTNHKLYVLGFYNGKYSNQLYIIATEVKDLGVPEVPQPDDNPFTSNVTWTLGNSAYDNNSLTVSYSTADAGYTVAEVPNVKLGTSSKTGSCFVILPEGSYGLSFYAVGWNQKDGILNVTLPDGVNYNIVAPQNSGAAGNGPYNLYIDESNYFEIIFEAPLSADTTVTFETVTGGPRAFLFGIRAIK